VTGIGRGGPAKNQWRIPGGEPRESRSSGLERVLYVLRRRLGPKCEGEKLEGGSGLSSDLVRLLLNHWWEEKDTDPFKQGAGGT